MVQIPMDMNEILDKMNGLLYDICRLLPNGPFSYSEDKYKLGFDEAKKEAYELVNIFKYWIKNNTEGKGEN